MSASNFNCPIGTCKSTITSNNVEDHLINYHKSIPIDENESSQYISIKLFETTKTIHKIIKAKDEYFYFRMELKEDNSIGWLIKYIGVNNYVKLYRNKVKFGEHLRTLNITESFCQSVDDVDEWLFSKEQWSKYVSIDGLHYKVTIV